MATIVAVTRQMAAEGREILSPRYSDSLDVRVGTDEGGAAYVMHDVAESVERSGINSLTPQFPTAKSDAENIGLYRNACTRLMRVWLKWATSDLVAIPDNEHDARIIAQHIAAQEIGRGLHAVETRLLDESVRDMLTARFIMRDMEVEDIRKRLHTPGRLFA